jgi:DNA polymerase III alpha subunit
MSDTTSPASIPAPERQQAEAYAHLHVHSFYSILDGLNDPYDIVREAGNHGQPAIALTDHKRLSGVSHFWDAIAWYNRVHAERHEPSEKCAKNGCHSALTCRPTDRCPKEGAPVGDGVHGTLPPITGILGLETYVAHNGRTTREKGDYGHLVLLSMNDTGWANLRTLASLASSEGFYQMPRIDWELLERHHEGLIALSACLGGHIAERLKIEGREATMALIRRYQALMGDRFYLELQWHIDQDFACDCSDHERGTLRDRPCRRQQHDFNRFLIDASAETGVPLVFTNDLHYARRDEAQLNAIMLANQQGKTIAEIAAEKAAGKATIGFDTPDFYVKSMAETQEAIKHWYRLAKVHDPVTAEQIRTGAAAWLATSVAIAARCHLERPFADATPKFPTFPLPDGTSAEQAIADLAWARAAERYPDMDERVRRLIAYELQCVQEIGFAPYFLITADFVDYARSRAAAGETPVDVGLGRGSAPGSIVTYVLGITDIDPIAFRLTEGGIGLTRFLNPTVAYHFDLDSFGPVPDAVRDLAVPSVEEMEAELTAELRERTRMLNAAAAAGEPIDVRTLEPVAEDRKAWAIDRWTTLKPLIGREWSVLRDRDLVEPLYRWWRVVREGGTPGTENRHQSLLALFIGVSSAPVNLLPGGELPLLPRYSFSHSRIGMPDIDIDFTPGEEGREKVMGYVRNKYGHDHVCQIATFGTMAARIAIKDVARAKGMPPKEADALAAMVSKKFPAIQDDEGNDAPAVSLREIIESAHPSVVKAAQELRDMMARDALIDDVIRTAGKLEGTVRSEGTHACGVLITPSPVTEYVSLKKVKESDAENPAVQAVHDGPTLADRFGLLKVDFLGLKNIKVNRGTIDRVRERSNAEVDWRALPSSIEATDAKAMELLASGRTLGIFQFGSDFATGIITEFRPQTIGDMMVATALGRPGPMDYIPVYIAARKKGRAVYEDQVFARYAAPIIDETFGVLVYQEQVMRLAIELCGFTLPESDGLRKATAKKDAVKLASFRAKFVAGAVEKGVNQAFIERYWDDVLTPFAAYSFNKSHSAAYASMAFTQAYLKANYPAEFMAALMTVDQNEGTKETGGPSVLSYEIKEAREMGIPVLPVDINRSTHRIEIEGENALRMSMTAIKGVGDAPVNAIVAERTAGGDFASFGDFIERMFERYEREKKEATKAAKAAKKAGVEVETTKAAPRPVNKTVVLALIKVGAFDAMDERGALLARAEAYFGTTSQAKREAIDWAPIPEAARPATAPREWLEWEREIVGAYLSAHPIDSVPAEVREKVTGSVREALAYERVRDRDRHVIVGLVSGLRYFPGSTPASGGRLIGTIDDGEAQIPFLFWQPKFDQPMADHRAWTTFRDAMKEWNGSVMLLTVAYGCHPRFGPQVQIDSYQRIEGMSAPAKVEPAKAPAKSVRTDTAVTAAPSAEEADDSEAALFGS